MRLATVRRGTAVVGEKQISSDEEACAWRVPCVGASWGVASWKRNTFDWN